MSDTEDPDEVGDLGFVVILQTRDVSKHVCIYKHIRIKRLWSSPVAPICSDIGQTKANSYPNLRLRLCWIGR